MTELCSCSLLDATDQLEKKVIEFFVNAKKNKPEWREEQMEVIKKVAPRTAEARSTPSDGG